MLTEVKAEASTETASYKPFFGIGDKDVKKVKGVKRFALLSLTTNGKSERVDYGREEIVYYVLEGSGKLSFDGKNFSISKDDFFYIPTYTAHSFATTQDKLDLLIMGYTIPEKTIIEKTDFEIVSAQQVEFQTLEQLNHGVTSRFKLLMGTTESNRDRLAVAYQVNSLFVIEFDPDGTNVPHRHPNEEEIYYVLQGEGDMVAGESHTGDPVRHPAREGDAFFISRSCLVGFYSSKNKDKPRARILAIRSKVPDETSE
ncbi:MAG: hypothetical protein DHS20C17_29660 [Cyclobacteriaceae bacterium]|nr:MAG: hypothetical protein DHS20C17_29660 [Cyclobacteriaceae bacterium]